jgi:hypothetical protein
MLPWAGPNGEGQMFVALGCDFDAYEAQMRRMAGLDDGIVDACFRLSRPVFGGYYGCPPLECPACSSRGAPLVLASRGTHGGAACSGPYRVRLEVE